MVNPSFGRNLPLNQQSVQTGSLFSNQRPSFNFPIGLNRPNQIQNGVNNQIGQNKPHRPSPTQNYLPQDPSVITIDSHCGKCY
jgi:hypothetical protein